MGEIELRRQFPIWSRLAAAPMGALGVPIETPLPMVVPISSRVNAAQAAFVISSREHFFFPKGFLEVPNILG